MTSFNAAEMKSYFVVAGSDPRGVRFLLGIINNIWKNSYQERIPIQWSAIRDVIHSLLGGRASMAWQVKGNLLPGLEDLWAYGTLLMGMNYAKEQSVCLWWIKSKLEMMCFCKCNWLPKNEPVMS